MPSKVIELAADRINCQQLFSLKTEFTVIIYDSKNITEGTDEKLAY